MSTYEASLIRKAGMKHECRGCANVILKGERYLAYKPGLHSTVHVCMACALSTNRNSGSLVYWCRSVEGELASRRVSQLEQQA